MTNDDMKAYLQACLANRYFMGSVLVARAGEVLLSAGYGLAATHLILHQGGFDRGGGELIATRVS